MCRCRTFLVSVSSVPRWHGFYNHGDPGNTGCAGVLAAIVIEDTILIRFFLAGGSSAKIRIEREGGAASWVVGTLAVPSVWGHGLPQPQELWPYQSLFLASGSWRSEGLFG